MNTDISLDPQWLDSQYNNRARVPDAALQIEQWTKASALARAGGECTLDLPYGQGPGETLDIFAAQTDKASPGERGAPVMVFVHGGYWRSLDKADHSFVAPAFTRQGACVVVPNYDLCPAVTVAQITLQMVHALAWVHRHIAAYGGDPQRITVVGHSAGGHLAAMLLVCEWARVAADLPAALVRNALSISGVFDLEPLRHTPFLQGSLRLDPEQVRLASPAWLPRPVVSGGRGRLTSVCGADESEEFLRQCRLIRKTWGKAAVPVCEALPGLNHFSVLQALVQPGQRLHQLAQQCLRP